MVGFGMGSELAYDVARKPVKRRVVEQRPTRGTCEERS
jgi:hypothetical protein